MRGGEGILATMQVVFRGQLVRVGSCTTWGLSHRPTPLLLTKFSKFVSHRQVFILMAYEHDVVQRSCQAVPGWVKHIVFWGQNKTGRGPPGSVLREAVSHCLRCGHRMSNSFPTQAWCFHTEGQLGPTAFLRANHWLLLLFCSVFLRAT